MKNNLVMKIAIKIFYYLSLLILIVENLALALMSGSENNIINFKNKESIILLLISLVFIVVLICQLMNKKIRYYSFFFSLLGLLTLIVLTLNLKLSNEGYFYVSWVVLVLIANFFLLKENKPRSRILRIKTNKCL